MRSFAVVAGGVAVLVAACTSTVPPSTIGGDVPAITGLASTTSTLLTPAMEPTTSLEDPDLCTEAKLQELLDRVIAQEWTARPDEIPFGAFVEMSLCRVVVQSDSFTPGEELTLGQLDSDGRILVEQTEGPVERRRGG